MFVSASKIICSEIVNIFCASKVFFRGEMHFQSISPEGNCPFYPSYFVKKVLFCKTDIACKFATSKHFSHIHLLSAAH